MERLTTNERKLLAGKLKSAQKFLQYFVKIVMIRPELSSRAKMCGDELLNFLENIPEILPEGLHFDAIIKVYNYAKDTGLDTEPGILSVAWQAELNINTFAFCTHTYTIDEKRKKHKGAKYEYKFQVWRDGLVTEEDIPPDFETYQVPFLYDAANPKKFRMKGAWLSADIVFETGL